MTDAWFRPVPMPPVVAAATGYMWKDGKMIPDPLTLLRMRGRPQYRDPAPPRVPMPTIVTTAEPKL